MKEMDYNVICNILQEFEIVRNGEVSIIIFLKITCYGHPGYCHQDVTMQKVLGKKTQNTPEFCRYCITLQN